MRPSWWVDQAVHGSRGGSRRSVLHAVGGPARYVDTGEDSLNDRAESAPSSRDLSASADLLSVSGACFPGGPGCVVPPSRRTRRGSRHCATMRDDHRASRAITAEMAPWPTRTTEVRDPGNRSDCCGHPVLLRVDGGRAPPPAAAGRGDGPSAGRLHAQDTVASLAMGVGSLVVPARRTRSSYRHLPRARAAWARRWSARRSAPRAPPPSRTAGWPRRGGGRRSPRPSRRRSRSGG